MFLRDWNKNEQGETLIEAMLAIALILMTLVGFLSLGSFNYLKSHETSNRNIAINLAREGVEIVRNVRDSNWMRGCPNLDKQADCLRWNSNLMDNVSARLIPYFDLAMKKWRFTVTNTDLNTCAQDKTCLMFINNQGIYSPNIEGDVTKFNRLIEINPICVDDNDCGGDGICQNGDSCLGEQVGMQVASLVRWLEGSVMKNVRQEERLYNWR